MASGIIKAEEKINDLKLNYEDKKVKLYDLILNKSKSELETELTNIKKVIEEKKLVIPELENLFSKHVKETKATEEKLEKPLETMKNEIRKETGADIKGIELWNESVLLKYDNKPVNSPIIITGESTVIFKNEEYGPLKQKILSYVIKNIEKFVKIQPESQEKNEVIIEKTQELKKEEPKIVESNQLSLFGNTSMETVEEKVELSPKEKNALKGEQAGLFEEKQILTQEVEEQDVVNQENNILPQEVNEINALETDAEEEIDRKSLLEIIEEKKNEPSVRNPKMLSNELGARSLEEDKTLYLTEGERYEASDMLPH